MNEVINRDRMHLLDEPAHEPHIPAKVETAEANAVEDMTAIPVHVTNPVATTTGATQFGAYSTVPIPASASTGPASYVQVLPHDPRRQYAYILSVDNPVVIATDLERAQASGNVGTGAGNPPAPQGAYLPANTWTPPIRHNEAVYVANTVTTGPSRIVVLVERGNTSQ